jgi:hypothetical protein
MTFDVTQDNFSRIEKDLHWYELFSVCRKCKGATIFVVSQKTIELTHFFVTDRPSQISALNDYVDIRSHISLNDEVTTPPPEHLPTNIEAAFKEGAACLAIRCFNAAGCMFRLCVDQATRAKLPVDEVHGPNAKQKRDLGLRLPWLFDKGYLPEDLRELSVCIKEDGNDGAHAGTLKKKDAEDLCDFTALLLERIYTQPESLRLAKSRREERRAPR